MVLTVSFVLSPVIGLVCHRHRRSCLHQLDAGVEASGPHDFAVREKRRSSARRSARPTLPASTASRPASVTIAKRPSVGRDGEGYSFDLGHEKTEKFLQKGLDTELPECPSGKSADLCAVTA
jgi:hypothetical protein